MQTSRLVRLRRSCHLALGLLAVARGAHAEEGAWLGRTWSGYAQGIDVNHRLRRSEVGVGVERRVLPALSIGGELAVVHFVGERARRVVDTPGLTAWPLVRWHFVRGPRFAADFVLGLGGALFASPFPPGGTRLNGYSGFGLGGRVHLSGATWLLADARLVHHSNGRGFVPDNPAFDGIAIALGVGVEGGR